MKAKGEECSLATKPGTWLTLNTSILPTNKQTRPPTSQSKSLFLQLIYTSHTSQLPLSITMMKPLCFLLLLALIFSSAQSRSIIPRPHPHPHPSLKINTTQNAGTCSYSVILRTSCSSTRYTRDHISLAFGDAYGNQVYAPHLDDPASRTFESCSTDTFQMYGPCTYQICYLYLYRSGYDGWMPYDVTVHGYNSQPATFYYNVNIPGDIWYGFNYCSGRRAASSTMK